MKTVFSSNEVAHIWAQQNQSVGRNQGGNIFFEGPTIYSYGGHFPMARFVDGAVLVTTRSYSVTTAKHLNHVHSAISGTAFYVDNVMARSKREHRENLQAMRTEYENTLIKSSRARTYVQMHLDRANGILQSANEYAAFFKLGTRIKPANLETIKARAKRAAAAERAAQNKARKAAAERFITESAEWRNHERYSLYGISHALLRLSKDGQTVETSQRATFPADHARRALPLIERCKDKGTSWERNGHAVHLGQYQLDKIDANGNVKAGCHRVEYAEIARLAAQL